MAIQEILGGVGVYWNATKTKLNAMFSELYTTKQDKLVNSAGLAAAVADETGSGVVVFNTSPSLVSPFLGDAVGTSLTTTSFITGKKCGVFAYLQADAATTIPVAWTYYAVNGTFINSPMEGFSLTATPGIRYDAALTQFFEVDWHVSFRVNVASTTVHYGLNKNGVLVPGSTMSQLAKTANEEYAVSGTSVFELATGDEVQLVVTSDGSGDIITAHHFTTSITEFFD